MKRFILICMVILLAAWVLNPHEKRPRREATHGRGHDVHNRYRHTDRSADDRDEDEGASADVREALAEARQEIKAAWKEVRHEFHDAYSEVRASISGIKHHAGPAAPPAPPFPMPPVPAEPVSGSQVIVVDTADRDATTAPDPTRGQELVDWVKRGGHVVKNKPPGDETTGPAPRSERDYPLRDETHQASDETASPATSSDFREVVGQISANEERARDDARRALLVSVRQWLGSDVPSSWTVPARLIDSMVRSTRIEPVIKDYGTLYIAKLDVDAALARRAAIVQAYNREIVRHRLFTLGGSLAFVLTCLAAFTGYVRADEATKGYYTNRLRTLVAAGIGAAGVMIYHMVA